PRRHELRGRARRGARPRPGGRARPARRALYPWRRQPRMGGVLRRPSSPAPPTADLFAVAARLGRAARPIVPVGQSQAAGLVSRTGPAGFPLLLRPPRQGGPRSGLSAPAARRDDPRRARLVGRTPRRV